LGANDQLLKDIKAVIAQYPDIKMTVRQVYYRLVAAQKVKNAMSEYNRVKRVLTDARRSGQVAYEDIEDRTRTVVNGERDAWTAKGYFDAYYTHFKTLDTKYDLPRWWGQETKVVVMVEKQALEGIFADVCTKQGVDLLVCRGYPSLSVLYELSQRLEDCDVDVQILYFGDWDPSGLDIDRSIQDSLGDDFGLSFEFERMAITRIQIDEYNIPPAPAKLTDSRTMGMEAKYGEAMQVELDAIDPPDLIDLITDAIDAHFDDDIYENDRAEELEKRQRQIKTWVSEVLK
jgi:hypothetical protein